MTEIHYLTRLICLAFCKAGSDKCSRRQMFVTAPTRNLFKFTYIIFICSFSCSLCYCIFVYLFTIFYDVVVNLSTCLPFFYPGVCCYIKQYDDFCLILFIIFMLSRFLIFPWINFSKIYRSESTSKWRFCHSCIKLKHTT